MNTRFINVLLGNLAVILFTLMPASAAPLLDFVGGQAFQNTGISQNLGWSFTLTSPLSIDGLGFWDEGANGLVNSHTLSLWGNIDTSPNQIAFATIDNSGTPVASTSPDGRWLFKDITTMILPPGHYALAATSPVSSDPVRVQTTAATISGATFDTARSNINSPATFPDSVNANQNAGFFGPNVRVVPEPSSFALLMLAVGSFGVRRTRRGLDR